MPALLPPFSGPRSTTSATPSQRHITPKVWHTASSAASGRRESVEQVEESRLPARVLADALRPRAAVVQVRVEVPRAAVPT